MKALGATVVHTPTEQGMTGAIAKAKELVNELPNSYSQVSSQMRQILVHILKH